MIIKDVISDQLLEAMEGQAITPETITKVRDIATAMVKELLAKQSHSAYVFDIALEVKQSELDPARLLIEPRNLLTGLLMLGLEVNPWAVTHGVNVYHDFTSDIIYRYHDGNFEMQLPVPPERIEINLTIPTQEIKS